MLSKADLSDIVRKLLETQTNNKEQFREMFCNVFKFRTFNISNQTLCFPFLSNNKQRW